MPATILLHDTPAHFASLFTAPTLKQIQHVDAYVASRHPKTGAAAHLGLHSFHQQSLLVVSIDGLPAAYDDEGRCPRVQFQADWSKRAHLQAVLFAVTTLRELLDKCVKEAAAVTPNASGWRGWLANPDVTIWVTNRPADKVYSPFINTREPWCNIQHWTPLSLAMRLVGGGYEDLRCQAEDAAYTRPEVYRVVRALIEREGTVIFPLGPRVAFVNPAFPDCLLSFRSVVDLKLQMAPPSAPTASNQTAARPSR